MQRYQDGMEETVLIKAAKVEEAGYEAYLRGDC